MARLNWTRAVVAGLVATAAMTALMLMAPRMGLPPMNIGAMLGSVMGGSLLLGWMTHFAIGAALALAYAAFFASRLPGPGFARGALYALAPWLAAGLMVMPMMGAGLFGGAFAAGFGSLMGHLVYGAVLGGLYRPAESRAATCPVALHA
ncbi:MAG TPA: DUF6789 family protein [Anaeromyxobacteraceae bacterium]|jgi:uncharacterized membrane protein YagU involved in acid resistance|nr:DUF6789 family protein [Anaeromyxobacteraceae bacterium]